jgi:hypothetical protein
VIGAGGGFELAVAAVVIVAVGGALFVAAAALESHARGKGDPVPPPEHDDDWAGP